MREMSGDDLQNATRAELIAKIEQLELAAQTGAGEGAARQPNFVHAIFDSLPIGVAYVDKHQVYHFANELYRTNLSNPTDKIIGRRLQDILAPETYKLAQKAIAKALDGVPVSFQDLLIQGSKKRYLNVNYLPDTGANDGVNGFYVLVQDITKQHDLQNELQGSEHKYQVLVDAIPHGIEEINTDGVILFANATHHKQYGYGPGELIGTNISATEVSAQLAEQVKKNLAILVAKQPAPKSYIGQKVKKNGEIIDVQVDWTYKRDAIGDVIGFIAIISDTTEQLKLVRAQKQAADQLELSLKSANIGTFSWNIKDNVSFWDDRMHDIWGLARGTFCNHSHNDFLKTIHPDDRDVLDAAITETLDKDVPCHVEYRVIRPSGRVIYVEVLAALSRNEQGYPIQLNGVCLDISERKAVENMKSEFVSTVSHELRTPLTSIRGALGLVLGGAVGSIPDEALEIMRMAEKNTTSLTKLVNDILDFERADSGKLEFTFETFELVSFLRSNLSAHQGLADEYGVAFNLTSNQPDIDIEADNTRIAQALANLLSNAAKYSPDGGMIEVNVQSGASDVSISVRDQGPGIPEDFQDKVFGRFTQASATDDRNFGGAGLGLSITKLIIERHQGEISFTTSPKTGTTFRFRLPLSQPKS